MGRVWIDGYLKLKEQASGVTSLTPSTNFIHHYAKDKSSVAELYYKNDAGTERDLSLVALLPASFTASRMAASDASGVLTSLVAQTQGAILFGNGTTQTFDISNLAWNNTTKVLGIGLSDPVFPNGGGLQIYRSDYPRLSLANSTTGATSADGYGLVGVGLDLYLENREAGNLIFTTTDTERFRIGASGQLGIGGATYGTAGQYFRSAGAVAAPTWATVAASEIGSGAAVTAGSTKITLAGSPSTAGLAAFSIDVNQANLDHGSIGGLGDDDHTQYVLLAGRSTGQNIRGGTGASENLILESTTHATKGKVQMPSGTQLEVLHQGSSAIGGSVTGIARLLLSGSFTSDGSDDKAALLRTIGLLTGAAGDTAFLTGLQFAPSGIATQTATESIALIASAMFDEPSITNNLTGGGVITVATTLYVAAAPTEGVSNYAMWVDAGNVRIDSLAGTGTRTVVADANGVLSAP